MTPNKRLVSCQQELSNLKEIQTMTPEWDCSPYLQVLSSLEAEPLDVFVYPSESEQDRNLATLTTVLDDVTIVPLSINTKANPVNGSCCCCCPACCCC